MSDQYQSSGARQSPHVPLLHGPQTEEECARETRENAEREDKKQRDAREERLVRATEAQASAAAQQHKTNAHIAYFTFLLVVVSLIGNVISWRAADAAISAADTGNKSLTASLSLLKGDNAARLELFPSVNTSTGILVLQVSNEGKISAKDAHFQFSASIESLPSFTNHPPFTARNLTAGVLAHGHNLEGTRIAIPQWSEFYPAWMNMQKGVIIKGKLEYDDGFGDKIVETICRRYVRAVADDGSGSTGVMDCEDAKSEILRVAEKHPLN